MDSTIKAIEMMERCMNLPRKIKSGAASVSTAVPAADIDSDVREIDAAELQRELHELKLGLSVLTEYVGRVELQMLAIQLANDEELSADIRAVGGGALERVGTEFQVGQLNDLLKRA